MPEKNVYYIFEGEEFDSLENMLLAQMEDEYNGKKKEFMPLEYLREIDWTPEEVLEVLRWHNKVEHVCNCNLDYETKEYEYDELDKEVS